MNKDKQIYVSSDWFPKRKDGVFGVFTVGKKYLVTNDNGDVEDGGDIIDDTGSSRYILFIACAHLDGKDWKVTETTEIERIKNMSEFKKWRFYETK